MDLVIILISETKYIKNHNDRIITLYNLFNRLISLSLGYGIFVEKESLILCLFKNDWFVDLVKTGKLEDEEQNKWRHDIYSRYGIVHWVRLDFKNAFNLANFESYLYSSLFPNKESEKSDQTENISEENTMEGENEIEWVENGEESNSEWAVE